MERPPAIIKYSIGMRELAMQTSSRNPIDLTSIHSTLADSIPVKNATKTPNFHLRDLPPIKLAFGPLGWDQVWASTEVDLPFIYHLKQEIGVMEVLIHNFLRLCCQDRTATLYGFEVRFPQRLVPERKPLPRPLNPGSWVLTSSCFILREWVSQVVSWLETYQNDDMDPGTNGLRADYTTITVRFGNKDTLDMRYKKTLLTEEESTTLRQETESGGDKAYTDTLYNGGPTTPHSIEKLQDYFRAGESSITITDELARNPRCYRIPFYLRIEDYPLILKWLVQQDQVSEHSAGAASRDEVEEICRERVEELRIRLEKIWKDIKLEAINAGVQPAQRLSWE